MSISSDFLFYLVAEKKLWWLLARSDDQRHFGYILLKPCRKQPENISRFILLIVWNTNLAEYCKQFPWVVLLLGIPLASRTSNDCWML